MLAREITEDLRKIRDGMRRGEIRELVEPRELIPLADASGFLDAEDHRESGNNIQKK